ncbi:PAS domain S-box protein [Halobaculum rubrum]|uniref:PAS domain S-box protein n=1 Tax=Halobaculum rubrum TaxID=2872158 RepID=UPI001CA40606|nr:PAS domain S-box protein [Halobaculum rubrum]QZX99206.1 PAS domain S-box protein [Halobaculum rubrum]
MSGPNSDDVRATEAVDVPVDGTVHFDASIRFRDLDAGAAAVLGLDPAQVDDEDILARLSRSPARTREALRSVVETGRPTSIEWEVSVTGPGGWAWAVPATEGVSVLLVVDDREPSDETVDPETEEDGVASAMGSSSEAANRLLAHTEALARTGGWEYDIESETLTWTAGTKRIHGVAPDFDPTIEQALSFYHPDDRERVRESVMRAVDAGESYETVARIFTPDGKRCWVRTIGEPVERDGEVTAVRGAIQDITETREQEQQIELLRRAIDAAPLGVTLADMRRDEEPLVYVNDAFEDLTGYCEAESIGRNCRFLQGDETDPETVAKLRAAIEAEESATVTIRNYRADGTPFWNRLTIAPVADSGGTVTHYVGFQTDVTERRDVESKLREFERAVEHSGHAIYITDLDGTITYVNQSFVDLTGYGYDEAVGETPRILNSGRMDDDYFEHLWNTILDGETFEERVIDKDSDGHIYRAHQTIAPLTDERGTVTGFVAVQTDITDRIERSQQIAVLDRVLRHNLRNDMNIVLGHAEKLSQRLEGDLAGSAETIASTGRGLLELADKERMVVEHLSMNDETDRHEVRPMVRSLVDELSERYPTAEFTTDCPTDLAVNATSQLPEAIEEFIENAVEHADDPSPSVEITAAPVVDSESSAATAVAPGSTDDADTVRISIADRGPGIPASVRDLVSSDYVPDSLTHTDGIGLWLASWIVTQSGGSIDFEDREAGGTVVHVTLPSATVPE